MINKTEDILNSLLEEVSKISEIQSIGISGSIDFSIPQNSDIDIFIYCETIPESKKRQSAYNTLMNKMKKFDINVFENGHWGTGDFTLINNIDTWLMYFTQTETLLEVEAILEGIYPDKLDNYYYPTGRCAMLSNINIIYDRNNFLSSLKQRLSKFSDILANKLSSYHLELLLDTEDLERAVYRKDILFYHFALDIALDHFLQALFAINKTYFPSRKRSLEYIRQFQIKPEECEARILEIISLGCNNIASSYAKWSALVNELKQLKYT